VVLNELVDMFMKNLRRIDDVIGPQQWWTPAPAFWFRTAHLRTIWSPDPHHTLSHRAPQLRFRTFNSAPDNFFMINFKKILVGFLCTTYFNPKHISTKGTGMKNKFIHSVSNICLAF